MSRHGLGDRPTTDRRAESLDRAVREVARYDIEQHLDRGHPGLGAEPAAVGRAANGAKQSASLSERSDGSAAMLRSDRDLSRE